MQRLSKIDPLSIANGPGFRVAVFVSGCRNACPGCFNKEAQDFNHGQPFDEAAVSHIVDDLMPNSAILGLTILGGEPLEPENQPMVLALEHAVRKQYGHEKTIWIYTGFTIERLYDPACRACTDNIDDILSLADVLVDGPFVDAKHDVALRFKGSSNQRLIDLPRTNAKDGVIAIWDDGSRRGTVD
jgi:anaerobic ribonucleoside-triphosphate reductase activating protein